MITIDYTYILAFIIIVLYVIKNNDRLLSSNVCFFLICGILPIANIILATSLLLDVIDDIYNKLFKDDEIDTQRTLNEK